jgi:uncharacterized protein
MDFNGSRALVTGASSGIGAVFARELARRGAHLILAARTESKLYALAAELREPSRVSVDVLPVDLAQPGAGGRLAKDLAGRGLEPDVLVNNAGFGLFAPLHQADQGQIAQEIQVNVVALTELNTSLLPEMLERDRGVIVNVASTAGFQPVPYMSVYGATKAYVLSFTEALWAETRNTGVRVTALCPGATDTSFFDVASEDASVGRRMAPEQVVTAALAAIEHRRSTVIPGLRNRMLANATRLTPRQFLARSAERTMRPKDSGLRPATPQQA